jgi:hypothetical protein
MEKERSVRRRHWQAVVAEQEASGKSIREFSTTPKQVRFRHEVARLNLPQDRPAASETASKKKIAAKLVLANADFSNSCIDSNGESWIPSMLRKVTIVSKVRSHPADGSYMHHILNASSAIRTTPDQSPSRLAPPLPRTHNGIKCL